MIVRITFDPPTRNGSIADPSFHERVVEGVPPSVAEQMTHDFQRFRQQSIGQMPIYRYETKGREVALALDFREVVALTTDPTPEGDCQEK